MQIHDFDGGFTQHDAKVTHEPGYEYPKCFETGSTERGSAKFVHVYALELVPKLFLHPQQTHRRKPCMVADQIGGLQVDVPLSHVQR